MRPGVLHAESEQADPQSAPPESFQNEARQVDPNLSMDAYFGGIRVDPFRSYPGPWQPRIPALADHYITHMAWDIPELDQPGNKGLVRSGLRTAAATTFSLALWRKWLAMRPAMHGDVASYRTHMEGFSAHACHARGGLHSLAGLGGLLRRMIVWIDLNASFLLDLAEIFPRDDL
ncbi:hypothetical protein E4U58_005278 [Claviceps cyperi]|nr:hypothetical protein E4U58_005278 [Claviceps cyperi]